MGNFFKDFIDNFLETFESFQRAILGDNLYDRFFNRYSNSNAFSLHLEQNKTYKRSKISFYILLTVVIILGIITLIQPNKNDTSGNSSLEKLSDSVSKEQLDTTQPYWSGSATPELVIKKNNLKILYIENKHLLYLKYFDGKKKNTQTIDTISGWSGIAPYVTLDSLDKNKVSIVIEIFTPAPSIAASDMYVYVFNTHDMQIKQLCYFESVGRYERENEDKFPKDIEFYDYFIDRNKKEIIVKEYKPYKSKSEKNKYTTVVEKRCGY